MGPLDSAEDLADEIWQVRLPNGSVQAMSIDEVDAAFTRGELDFNTKVQRPSGGDWVSIAEAAGMAGDSITPMAVAVSTDLRANIPRPPPLPFVEPDDAPLSAEELSALKPRRAMGPFIGAMGAAALLIGGIVTWHYLPGQPTSSLAATTIPAPPDAPAADPIQPPAPESTNPPDVAPETSPAPEGNALTDTTAKAPPPPAKKAIKTKKRSLKKPDSVTTFTIKKHIVVKSQ